jgi:hypothetical protein
VRSAEDLEGGAFDLRRDQAIASGNPAVMEKVRIDTEVRKLDQLRAVHLNQQHKIRWQLRHLPRDIAGARQTLDHLQADLVTRDAYDGEEFVMTMGKQVFSGKGAREEAARALVRRRRAIAPRRLHAAQARAFKGFAILSRGQPAAPVPDLFIRGAGTYSAHINADNPIGTMQSIEHTLRALDRAVADEQAQRPFEHEARLKELLARQAQLNAALDLDKATPRPRKRRPNLTLRLRCNLAAASYLCQRRSRTPCQHRSPNPTTERGGRCWSGPLRNAPGIHGRNQGPWRARLLEKPGQPPSAIIGGHPVPN